MTQTFDYHVFLCLNTRLDSKQACGNLPSNLIDDITFTSFAEKTLQHLKIATKKLQIDKKIRISKAGCLGRCSLGPVMVIYPSGVWYKYGCIDDIDEIINSHIKNDKIVQRLLV